MPRDKTATHIRVMKAAKEEFLEHGFEKASMRAIGDRCGMTAAGIYRHCLDKQDLFAQLVQPYAERVEDWLKGHIERYREAAEDEEILWQDCAADLMREIIYPEIEAYHLLLAKSKGTKYADFLHDMLEQYQQAFLEYLPVLSEKGFRVWDMDPKELHLLLTAYITALFEPVIHNYSKEEAERCLRTVEVFFLPGWKTLLGF